MKIKSVKFYQHVDMGPDQISWAAAEGGSMNKGYKLELVDNIGVRVEGSHKIQVVTFNNIASIELYKEAAKPAGKKGA